MARARVDGSWQEIPDGATVTRSLGDAETIWDLCGCMGLCPSCRAEGRMRHEGCGARYAYGRVRGAADPDWFVELPGGEQFWASEVGP